MLNASTSLDLSARFEQHEFIEYQHVSGHGSARAAGTADAATLDQHGCAHSAGGGLLFRSDSPATKKAKTAGGALEGG